MSAHRKDQGTCEQGLRLLASLAIHLSGTEDNDTELQKARDIGTHTIKAFWWAILIRGYQQHPLIHLNLIAEVNRIIDPFTISVAILDGGQSRQKLQQMYGKLFNFQPS